MNKKYYDGEILNNVLIKNTYDAGQYLKLIKAFSEEKGVDAVEVVRCKDCIYYYPAEYDKKGNTCLMLRNMVNAPIWVKEDDYCSKGVKE